MYTCFDTLFIVTFKLDSQYTTKPHPYMRGVGRKALNINVSLLNHNFLSSQSHTQITESSKHF